MIAIDADVIDAEDEVIVSAAAYEACTKLYWVSAWKNEHEPAGPSMWCFSQKQPPPVPNPTMFWRRPTYQEALIRQGCFLAWRDKCSNAWWPGAYDYWEDYVIGRTPFRR